MLRNQLAKMTAVFAAALCLHTRVAAQTSVETVLHSFTAQTGDGASPYTSVIAGGNGVLYGTTWGGGVAGTVFRINADGTGFALLHHFTNSPDGATPFSSLVPGADGWLYGTTYAGGVSNVGTVFKLGVNGSGYTVLHSFTNVPDGANPRAGLMQGSDGYLYGTTTFGGTSNLGSVFKLGTDGSSYTVLHSFAGNFVDGTTPYAGLVQGADGSLYGTTQAGGNTLGGTVYRLGPTGGNYSILHTFVHGTDGAWPEAGLWLAGDGLLYGTTSSVGPGQSGTVFKLQTDGGGFQVLHSFTNSPDGSQSLGGLVQGCDGLLYGTTAWGGVTNGGVLFRLNTNGTGYAILHHFDWSGPDGSHPYGTLAGTNGVFYGATEAGGAAGFGTVYQFACAPSLAVHFSGSDWHLQVAGVAGQTCSVEYSTNLVQWSPLREVYLTNGYVEYPVTNQVDRPRIFYRGVLH